MWRDGLEAGKGEIRASRRTSKGASVHDDM